MTSRYKILFTINVLHDYYSDLKSTDISFVPCADTLATMQAGGMLWRMIGNRLVILVKVNDADEPGIPLSERMKLRFYMQLDNTHFTTITNIDLDAFGKKRLYFSNLGGHVLNDILYLSRPLDAYNGATEYSRDTMIAHSGITYECIKTPVAGHNTGEAAFWHNRGAARYASASDMTAFSTELCTVKLNTENTVFDIKVNGFNASADAFDIEWRKEVRTTQAATKDVQVNLAGLPKGRYNIIINGESFRVYADADVIYSGAIGLVELFNSLPGSNAMALLNDAGKTKEHVYTMRFANRLAHWKYLTTRQGVKSIKDGSSTYTFNQFPDAPATAEYFESDKPIPLKQTPRIFDLELTAPLGEPPPAPNPNPYDSSMLTRNGDQYICKVYLNY